MTPQTKVLYDTYRALAAKHRDDSEVYRSAADALEAISHDLADVFELKVWMIANSLRAAEIMFLAENKQAQSFACQRVAADLAALV